jgi:hypothetical protein
VNSPRIDVIREMKALILDLKRELEALKKTVDETCRSALISGDQIELIVSEVKERQRCAKNIIMFSIPVALNGT